MILFRDLFRRLCQSYRWIAAQFAITLLLILIGVAWTRLPEKHVWQVALSLLLPLLFAICALELQAGTMRSLANDDGKRVKLPWGASSLLFWIAIVWVCWAVLDWCDDRIYQWAGYLNSQAPVHWRAKFLTYQHLSLWMTYVEWVFRWIVVPAKVIPYAIASAQSGWCLPVRRILHLLWNWRWWLGVTIVALVSVALPGHFFSAAPHGTVSAQEARVGLKLAAAYMLAVGGWIVLLAWAGVLFGRQTPLPESDVFTELYKRLRSCHHWIWAQCGWVLLFGTAIFLGRRIPDDLSWKVWILALILLVLLILELVIQVGMLRSLLNDCGRHVRMIWGALSMLLWAVLCLIVAFSLSLWHVPIAPWVVGWMVAPGILLPFASASAVWGLRLPWRRLLRLLMEWKWWLGLMAALAMGVALPCLIVAAMRSENATPSIWITCLRVGVNDVLSISSWALLLSWFAVLFERQQRPTDEAPSHVPAFIGPPEPELQASVKLSLPEGE